MDNSLETAPDNGIISYTSTYDYAVESTFKVCADTDGDGIGDVIDIDDDNDGVLDTVEAFCRIQAVNKTGITVSTPPNVTYSFTAGNSLANLIDGIDNNVYIMSNPTGTLNNAPLLTVKFSQPKRLTYFEIGHYQSQYLLSLSSTYKIQASNDSINWVDVTGTLTYNNATTTTSGGYSSYNSNIANINTPVLDYTYYRIYGISVTAGNGWATELYFKEYACNNADTDGDNIENRLDPDSDGDGCSDAREAGATASTTSNYQFTGADANANGLVDAVENGTTGTVNYVSTYNLYAVSNFLNLCQDTDGDGVKDFGYLNSDIDVDNDGVVNITDAPACYYSATEANTIVSITSALTSPDDDQTDGDIQLLHNGALTTYTFNFEAGQHINGYPLFIVKYPTPVALASMTINNNTSFGASTTARLQGSLDSITWVDASTSVSLATTASKVFTSTNGNAYTYYRILGDGGTAITTTSTTIAEISSVLVAGYNSSTHPKNACITDTDNDGLTNNMDLDSDGDGCSDAKEAGATSSNTGNYQFSGTDANGNGLVDAIENGTTGTVNYPSTYAFYGTYSFLSLCADFDADGVADLTDIDDDNDGVLDATEAPACYYTATEATVPASISTGMTSTVNAVAVTPGADIPTMHDGITTSASASNHVIAAAGASFVGATIYTVQYKTPVNLSSLSVTGSAVSWGTGTTATLYGSNDSATWTSLMSAALNTAVTTVPKTFTVNQNAAQYRYYQIRGTAGTGAAITNYEVAGTLNAASYNPSAHPKNTCAVDNDADGVYNMLDLDSDADGCSDAIEAGVAKTSGGPAMEPGVLQNGSGGTVTSETTTTNAVVSGPYNANGFADNTETAPESGSYNGSYTYSLATNGSPAANCATLSEVLPITLLEFTVKPVGKAVLLNWKTTNEVNNQYFDIERSANSLNWTPIGKVKGINEPGFNEYSFTDQLPDNGNNYYRLKQVDIDGRYSYSPIRVAKLTNNNRLQLMPNPAHNYLVVRLTSIRAADIIILDALGKNVTPLVSIQPGGAGAFRISIHRLTNGYYLLKVKEQKASFIKVN